MKSSDELIFANMNVHYFRYPFSYFLEHQVALGFDSFLFWGSVPHIWVDQFGYEDVPELKDLIRKHKVKLLAYATRPYNYSLFAPKGSLQRKHTESYYRFCIDIAQELETDQICIDLWGALRDGDYTVQYENCLEMLANLCTYAKVSNCAIVVGNVSSANSALINTLDEVQRLKNELQMSNLKISLDVCTALENCEIIEDWLNIFEKDLSIIYLADGRNTCSGLPLGYGCYPIAKTLRLLKDQRYRGTVAIKMNREKSELNPTRTDKINITYLRRI